MHISSITIDNFRGLRDFRMEGARMFNLLVGPSEIGKTTVLEAISLMSIRMNMTKVISINQIRGAVFGNQADAVAAAMSLFYEFRLQPIKLETTMESAFGNVQMKLEITPALDDKVVAYHETGAQTEEDASSPEFFDGLKYTVRYGGAASGGGHSFLRFRDNDIHLDNFVEEDKICRVDKAGKKHDFSANDEKSLLCNPVMIRYPDIRVATSEATINKKQGVIVKVLEKINPKVAGFALSDKTPLIDIGLDRMVPMHIAGDGLRRVLGTLGNLCSKKYNVHLDDEIGAGVYFGAQPEFLRAVLRFAKEDGKQIFATTHSKDMLIALKQVLAEEEDLRDDAAVFSFMRDKKGKVRADAYLYDDIDHCLSNGLEIR